MKSESNLLIEFQTQINRKEKVSPFQRLASLFACAICGCFYFLIPLILLPSLVYFMPNLFFLYQHTSYEVFSKETQPRKVTKLMIKCQTLKVYRNCYKLNNMHHSLSKTFIKIMHFKEKTHLTFQNIMVNNHNL